jgi:hypothetical protein
MPAPQPDTGTAVALSGVDTVSSRFGIEGQSVLRWPEVVKSRSGEAFMPRSCLRSFERLGFRVPMPSATANVKSFFEAGLSFAIVALRPSS